MRAMGMAVRRVTPFCKTAPVDVTDQPWFLNCVAEVGTAWTPRALLRRLQSIERRLGRRRTTPKGPRTIDLDILLYENQAIHTSDLVAPHPRLAARRFVLEAMCHLRPQLRHPVLGQTMSTLRRKLIR